MNVRMSSVIILMYLLFTCHKVPINKSLVLLVRKIDDFIEYDNVIRV